MFPLAEKQTGCIQVLSSLFSLVAIPVYVKHLISFKENSSSGRFDVTIGPKQNMGKTVEGVVMTVHMPKAVLNMNLTATQGSYTFDPVTKVSLEVLLMEKT